MNEIREFVTPQKRIVSEESLNIWLKSESLKNLVSYINELSDSVKGWPIQKNVKVQEPNIKSILKLFDNLEDYIVECPPTNDPSRYGNKAYQSWCDKLNEHASKIGRMLHSYWLIYLRILACIIQFWKYCHIYWTHSEIGQESIMALVMRQRF
eukprot:GHVL01027116.1.p1 GENE.GHVL01027116.1~~GHVL01027116.1.p1  ORF type:complete len:153 (+),score=21.86 GHVL01027116.1:51-509(+)